MSKLEVALEKRPPEGATAEVADQRLVTMDGSE
jgi:hypothetical protein